MENEQETKPIPRRRFTSSPMSKSIEQISKSNDSLEAIQLEDDPISLMERRRSSYEFRINKLPPKPISISSENLFEKVMEKENEEVVGVMSMMAVPPSQELFSKRSSASDISMLAARDKRHRMVSKSTENLERIEINRAKNAELNKIPWRLPRRSVPLPAERESLRKSDDYENNDRLEQRKPKVRRPSKRLSGSNIIVDGNIENDRPPTPPRKPSFESKRMQKSSESSELGSTDTLDSDVHRRNKLSDSNETIDSLEKDQEIDRRTFEDDNSNNIAAASTTNVSLYNFKFYSKKYQAV